MHAVRVFWPSDLHIQLRKESGPVPLCGFYARPTGDCPSKFVDLIIVCAPSRSARHQLGVVDAAGRVEAIAAQFTDTPGIAGWQAQLCCLGYWRPRAGEGVTNLPQEGPVCLESFGFGPQVASTTGACHKLTLPHLDLNRSRCENVTAWQVRKSSHLNPTQHNLRALSRQQPEIWLRGILWPSSMTTGPVDRPRHVHVPPFRLYANNIIP